MKKYGLISKGLNVTGLRITGNIKRFLFRKLEWENRHHAESYLSGLPYDMEKNLKVVKISD